MLANYTSPDGQSTLIPAAGIDDFTDVQTQITKLFTADPITKESATVVVLNATDTSGLATAQRSVLVQKGMTATTADAPVNQPTNTIVDNSQGVMPNTLAYLKQRYKATIVTNVSLTAGYPAADFILILGQAAVPAPKTTTTGQ
jgi:hypothetical protein